MDPNGFCIISSTKLLKNQLAKGVCALRGEIGPLWSQKLKIAFHQFHPIGLLEEWSKCKILAFILHFPLL